MQMLKEKSNKEVIREQQYKLLRMRLQQLDPTLSDIFVESLRVLKQSNNPFRFNLAAHGIRTLINSLPESLGIPGKELKQARNVKINSLIEVVKKKMEATSCKNNNWNGEIDKHLSKMLKKIDEFLKWDEEHPKKRKEKITMILDALDKSPVDLPDVIKSKYTEIFDIIRDFFVDKAHVNNFNDLDEFEKQLNSFVRFMLDKLGTETINRLHYIDDLIQRGQSDD